MTSSTYARRRAIGDFGERVAARHLQEHGFEILDRNWRCREGEIDIVARDGATLVVCEVKTRTSTRFGTPLEAITPRRAGRLQRLGRRWAREHHIRYDIVRLDVVAVTRPPRSPMHLEHVVGVA